MRRLIARHLAVLGWCLAALPAVASAAQPKPAPDPVPVFDALAARARTDWAVPGLAVAVVREGKVLLAKGYGVREQGKTDAVDADTLFAAASTTKAMTVVALGMLVDEGKLHWDDPVRRLVPELALKDPTLADELTVRDLLTHHTGLPETDFLWFAGTLDWRGILGRLAKVERVAPARSRFEYQNVMYGLAGDLAGRVSGLGWAELVRQRIFTPLGMTRSVPLGAEVAARGNFVTPHTREDGALHDSLELVDPIPAAGAVWSSARDLAKWVAFLLAPEEQKDAKGRPLLQPETVAEIFRPQVVIQPGGFYPTAEKTQPHWTTYGLGWFQQDYRGRKIDFHTGSIDGLVAIVGLARDQHFGVVVLANLDHAELRHALMLSAFDLFLDGALGRDWNRELRAFYDEARRKEEEKRQELEAKRVTGTRPSLAPAAYAGVYEDALHGRIDVAAQGEELLVRLGQLAGRAEHWHFDTYRVRWERKLYGISWATFRLGAAGTVESLDLDGVSYARPVAAKETTTP